MSWGTRIGAALASVGLFTLAVLLTRWIIGASGDPANGIGVAAGAVTVGLGFAGINLLRVGVAGDRDGFFVIRDGLLDYCDMIKRGGSPMLTVDVEDGATLSECVNPEALR